MILANGYVMDATFTLQKLDIRLAGDKIVELGNGLTGDEILDLRGKYILPGFIDSHMHGANGGRVSGDLEDLRKITQYQVTQGVTSIAVTTATSEHSELLRQISVAHHAAQETHGAKIAAIHAEGPFINRKRKGAMDEKNIAQPDIQKFDQMREAGGGLLKLMTMAPELVGSEQLIRYAKACGVTVSLGHTDATLEEANRGFAAGASQLTHTFNGMRPLNHRDPGVLGAGLTNPEVVCEMICDYVHLHPATVQLIYRAKGADRINLISDSEQATGMKLDEFSAGGMHCYVKDGVIRLPDGTIAGSAKSLLDGVRNLLRSGIPLEDVSKMASRNPAKTLQIWEHTGSIQKGKQADLVVLTKEYDVLHTFVDGKLVYTKE